jgi:hypothetical protein
MKLGSVDTFIQGQESKFSVTFEADRFFGVKASGLKGS